MLTSILIRFAQYYVLFLFLINVIGANAEDSSSISNNSEKADREYGLLSAFDINNFYKLIKIFIIVRKICLQLEEYVPHDQMNRNNLFLYRFIF